ncbi:MAG: DUF4395 domain-containing protein [Candidatus Woesearchaeota archaeon]
MAVFEFGRIIPGLKIHGKDAPYRVLNERDARAAAGIMFVLGVFAFVNALVLREFLYVYTFVVLFFLEFGIRIFVNPSFAPFYALGSLMVKNQISEYTGAPQKRFAWALGFGLATVMMVGLYAFNIRGLLPLSICMLCLLLLWLESSFGICVGCKMYWFAVKHKMIKEPEHRPACPGGVCKL